MFSVNPALGTGLPPSILRWQQVRAAAAATCGLHRPPSNAVVRRQDALAYLRALPCQAPRQCVYADPPYIFPGCSMNYYGPNDLAFHSELRDALFASGLPFVVSVNDVPEAREPTPSRA